MSGGFFPSAAADIARNSSTPIDPYAPMRSMAETLGAFNNIRQQNAVFGARQQLGQIIATSPDFATAMERIQKSPSLAFAPELLTQTREARLAELQALGEQQKIGQSGMEFWYNHGARASLADPSSFDSQLSQWRATQPDTPMTNQNMQALRDAHTALTANTSDDPNIASTQLENRRLGQALASGMNADDLKWTMGAPDMYTASDGSTYPIWRGGALGGPYGGGPGGMTFVGPGFSPGVKPAWAPGPGGVPAFTPGVPSVPIPPPGGAMPPAGAAQPPPPAAVSPAVAPPAATGPDYSPGAVTAEPLPPPAAGGAPTAAAVAPASAAGGAPAAAVPPPGGVMAAPGTAPSAAINWPEVRRAQLTEGVGKAFDTHYKELAQRVDAGRQLMQSIGEMRDLMGQVKTGPMQAWEQPLSTFAAKIGASKDIVDGLAGGNFAAAQELQKFFVTNTMGQLRQQLPPDSQLNLQEWSAFVKNNPNLETDPTAVEKIFNFWTKQYNYNNAELGQFSDWVLRDGQDPRTWGAEWSRRAVAQHFISPGQEQGQARGSAPAPVAPTSAGARPPIDDILSGKPSGG